MIKDDKLQKAVNIITLTNALYAARNRSDIPIKIVNQYTPVIAKLNEEFNNIVLNDLFETGEKDLSSAEDEAVLSQRVAEEKAKLKKKPNNRKIEKKDEA